MIKVQSRPVEGKNRQGRASERAMGREKRARRPADPTAPARSRWASRAADFAANEAGTTWWGCAARGSFEFVEPNDNHLNEGDQQAVVSISSRLFD